MELTITQIAARLGVSERTAQRWIAKGTIHTTQLHRNWYSVDEAELKMLAARYQERNREVATLQEKVAELEQRISVLEHMIEGLQPSSTSRVLKPTHSIPTVTSLGDTLPHSYTSWRSFAELHHIAATTVQKAITSGRLQAIEGDWKVGRAIVRGALDENGQAQFYTLYHTNPNFQPCTSCPHQISPD